MKPPTTMLWRKLGVLLALMATAAGAAGQTATTPAPPAGRAADNAEDDEPPAAGRRPTSARASAGWRFGVERLRLEAAAWPDAERARWGGSARLLAFAQGPLTPSLELRLGGALDGDLQRGRGPGIDHGEARLGDTWIRYRQNETRLTLGLQTIVWGRVDAIPLIDRVSRVDLRRFALDDLQERRLPQGALRLEQGLGDYKLDAVWLADFSASKLPQDGSVWHPIDRPGAHIISIDPMPALAPFLAHARLERARTGQGGGAVRLTRTGEALDFGVTAGRVRQPLPYFELDPAALAIRQVHPFTRFVGLDAEIAGDSVTWRSELTWTWDAPITAIDGRMLRTSMADWIGGVEFFPGGRNTRVNLQLAAHSARSDHRVQEIKHYLGLNGEIETQFDQGRWKAALRFAAGLNARDNYLAPRLAFVGMEPHEFYVGAHLFGGEDRTVAGFHRRHDALVLGLKTRF